ncbi:early activation antigen CD69-like isoform X1 [Dermochelys coriacea]|uniref:early activation antigen CD69-like isoform X1 n=1 Tax=Dermochelys coriacea TaxID=27794 RepID=UPI001CA7B9A4|nr:early activation antigen CD69-like isoform X1 [Dermochelys coriacea]XP_043353031.1 early activation antigen CD69-like isoform X1 [Dermochelys coriacea]
MNESPVLESMSLSGREKMCNELSSVETTEPEPDLGSQETPMKENRTTPLTVPAQGGESCTICPTGLLSWLTSRAHRWAVPSVVLNLLLSIIIVVLIAVSAPAKKSEPCSAGPACPDGWIGYLGKCYYFSETEGNWTYSQNNCSALGASLAVIDTQQEMDFLLRYKGRFDHWIGLRRELDQPWMWTNGTEFNNWFKIVGGGLCAFVYNAEITSSGCSREGRWICLKPAEKTEGRAK